MQKMLLLVAALLAGAGLLTQCTQNQAANPQEEAGANAPSEAELVARGGYLVTIGGCNDCHTPKIMTAHGLDFDSTRLLSGHPANEPAPKVLDLDRVKTGEVLVFNGGFTSGAGPWGTSFSANLTPDDTGTGNWTFDQFKKAIREGKSKGMDGTRPLLPPMPWFNYAKMSDDDLRAVFAYLRSLPPINNAVPTPLPPAS